MPVTVGIGSYLNGVACPSTDQCTAISAEGEEVTFNPNSPGTPTPMKIAMGYDLTSVACPSTSQCTAVGSEPYEQYEHNNERAGQEVTFNPTSPGTPTPVTIGNGMSIVTGVACPSTSQCTAVDTEGEEETFNPNSPGTRTLVPIVIGSPLNAIACPSTSQCTAVGSEIDGSLNALAGREVTFNPNSPGTPTPVTDSGGYGGYGLLSVACPSTTYCVAVDGRGRAFEGNPASTGSWTINPIGGATSLGGVFCTSPSQCVAVDSFGRAFVGSPGPTNSLTVSLAGAGTGSVTGNGISCPSTCSASEPTGTMVTLTATPVAGSAFSGWSGGGCSGTGTCTVTMSSDQAVTATFTVSSGSGGGSGGDSGGGSSGDSGGGASAASVGHASASGTGASVSITCPGPAGTTCATTVTLTVTETFQGHKLASLSSVKTKKSKQTKKVLTVGSASVVLQAGQTQVVRIPLNSAGKRLLSGRHKLSVKLTVDQSQSGSGVISSQTVTFKAPGKKKSKDRGCRLFASCLRVLTVAVGGRARCAGDDARLSR
jgi:hypothetical protein